MCISFSSSFVPESEVMLSRFRLQRRHVVTILAFFGFANIYAMRANLSVAIVQMTSDTIATVNGQQREKKAEFGEWDSVTQGAILGAFFYGYILTQLPGGCLAHRYGGKYVYFMSIFGTAVFTLLSPPLAKMGKSLLMAARFFEGFFEGVSYPSMHAILANWAPVMEKTRMTAIAYTGSYVGTVVAMPVSAVLGQQLGWPSIFYFFGMHPNFIKFFNKLSFHRHDELSHATVPWKHIFGSKAVWAIVVAHICQNWGFYTMLTSLPRILENLLSYDHQTAGSLAALPYLAMGLLFHRIICPPWYLRNRLKIYRFVFLGLLGEAVFLLLATTGVWDSVILISLIASVGLGGLAWSAFSVNSLDIAPQYAGYLMGLSNTLATLPGMISPLFVGSIVKNQVASEWHSVFFFTSGIYIFGAFMFWLWARGEVEEWASNRIALSGADD
ncbi:unnamed protein product [Gongylonema pulchrum]|uniref:Sialin n=1 Tax=Gongylonema pulchrum TaxID=637853 RepID=A0A183CVJ4_9BILA|nr:unnamed protein product [Gongylonema pulchrum]